MEVLKIAGEAKVCFGVGVLNILVFSFINYPFNIFNVIVATLGFGLSIGMVLFDTFVRE